GVGARVSGRPVCDQLALALDAIAEPEARSANVAAPRVDGQPVVEVGRHAEADVRVECQCLDPLGLQLWIAAAKAGEVLDPRDFEPDEVDGVMRYTLRVRLGKANLHLGREAKVHGRTLYDRRHGRVGARPSDQGEPAVRRSDRS